MNQKETKHECFADGCFNAKKIVDMEQNVKELEAKLRNKVIEECINNLHGLSVFRPEQIFRILNSLKTKV